MNNNKEVVEKQEQEQVLVDEIFNLYFNLKTDIPDSGLKFDYKNFRDVSIFTNHRINKIGDNTALLFSFDTLNRDPELELRQKDVIGLIKKIKYNENGQVQYTISVTEHFSKFINEYNFKDVAFVFNGYHNKKSKEGTIKRIVSLHHKLYKRDFPNDENFPSGSKPVQE